MYGGSKQTDVETMSYQLSGVSERVSEEANDQTDERVAKTQFLVLNHSGMVREGKAGGMTAYNASKKRS